MSLTSAHINCLSRIDRGEPVGDLENVLGSLYLRELVRGASPSTIELTDDGRAVLAAHDALPETRKVERPRLVSRPIPKGWHLYCLHEGEAALLRSDCWTWLIKPVTPTAMREQRAVLTAMEWSVHEAAVRAQEVKP